MRRDLNWRNIQDLAAEAGPQWDLYIRALLEMQQANYTDTLSYFQIEGIHGRPFIEWNSTGSRATDGWAGYCPHGELLFLSWHRPYVVLFEQVLVLQARKIASTYPPGVRDQYMQAAEELRAPFWDWAADATVPAVTVPPKMKVKVPNGQGVGEREVDNPLFTFKIPQSVVDGEYGSFDSDNRNTTMRCPAPQSYPNSANDLLSQRPYKDWVYDAFARADNFSEFSSVSDRFVSMELVHNGIHWDAACGQQFLGPDLSGFDPLFMLHHSNMDRLWAYWQAVRPDEEIFQGSYSGLSRFGSPEGSTITAQSPLQPFFGLNDKALRNTNMTTLPVEHAADAIATSMKVQIVKPDGTVVSNVTSLKVSLEDVEVTPPRTPDSFPTFGLSNFFQWRTSFVSWLIIICEISWRGGLALCRILYIVYYGARSVSSALNNICGAICYSI
ncbi:hypothetical protein ACCO45_013374 [Purpureocillium lilacinum]|uniref:Uncharacterized protein n=1 Tax=Purpureocillium lilacinum TaxID=33203 RepID=A0ACC4DAN0_PURLI